MERIREIRTEMELSQAALAARAEMDPAALNRLEAGKGSPTLKTLERLAAALGVEMGDLFPKARAPLFQESPEASPEQSQKLHGRRIHGRRIRVEVTDSAGVTDMVAVSVDELQAVIKAVSDGKMSVNQAESLLTAGWLEPWRRQVERQSSEEQEARPDYIFEPEVMMEWLHNHGVWANLSESSVLNQMIWAEGRLVEEEPVDWERLGFLLAFVLATDLLTEDETKETREVARRAFIEARGLETGGPPPPDLGRTGEFWQFVEELFSEVSKGAPGQASEALEDVMKNAREHEAELKALREFAHVRGSQA